MRPAHMVITACFIGLGLLDLYLIAFCGMDASISRFLQMGGQQSNLVLIVLGYILGHIFGFMEPNNYKCPECNIVKRVEPCVECRERKNKNGGNNNTGS